MRILVINNTRSSEANPKRGSYITSIGECLGKAGFDVDYLLPRTTGLNVFTKIISYCRFYTRLIFFRFTAYDQLYINHYTYVAIPLLIRFRVLRRSIIHWHGEDLLPSSKLKAILFKPMLKLLPRTVLHIVPSKYFKGCLQQFIPRAKIIVSPSGGVDLRKFSSSQRKTGRSSIRIGHASGLAVNKGLQEIKYTIENLELLENKAGRSVELHYIDFGRGKGSLDGIKTSARGKLISWNIMPPGRMPEFYNSLDILLFPTRRKAESLGLIPLEAMACGVAVVATDGFACPEYVIPGISGELFDPDVPNDFITTLIKCFDQLESYRPREVIKDRYSRKSVVEQYREQIPKNCQEYQSINP